MAKWRGMYSLLGLTIAVALLPLWIGDQYVSALVLAAVYTVIATGLNVFMGATGQISFGHNAFVATGGYGSAILATALAWPPILTLVLAAVLTLIVAVIVGYPTLRLRGHYLAMATFGLGMITTEVTTQWISLTQGPYGISAIPPLGVGSWELKSDTAYYYTYWMIAAFAIWLAHRITHSRVGFALRAIAGDETAAQSLGVDVPRYKLVAFTVSAVFASVGGSLFAHYVNYISPEVFGLHMVILLFTMLFAGGINTTFGPMIGAVAITLLPELLRGFASGRGLIYGLILLVMLMFAPRGLSELRKLFMPRTPILTGSAPKGPRPKAY